MSTLYEELKDLLGQEKGAAMATVVRGPKYVGKHLLVLPGKQTDGTLGHETLDAMVAEDAERAIWNGEAARRTYTIESATGALPFDVFI